MPYPIKYIENNLVWNIEGECFAYYELIPFNYSFLSLEQKDAVNDAFRQLIAQNRDGKIHALQISTESSIRAAQERSKKSVTGRLKEIACAEIDEQTENLVASLGDTQVDYRFFLGFKLVVTDKELSVKDVGKQVKNVLSDAMNAISSSFMGDFVSMPNDEIRRYIRMEKLMENKLSRRFKVRRLNKNDFGYLLEHIYGRTGTAYENFAFTLPLKKRKRDTLVKKYDLIKSARCLIEEKQRYLHMKSEDSESCVAYFTISDVVGELDFPSSEIFYYQEQQFDFAIDTSMNVEIITNKAALHTVRNKKKELKDLDNHAWENNSETTNQVRDFYDDASIKLVRPIGDMMGLHSEFIPASKRYMNDYVQYVTSDFLAGLGFGATQMLGERDGIYLGYNVDTDQNVYVQPARAAQGVKGSVTNALSGAFLGSLGGGKSLSFNLLTYYAVLNGAQALILDPKSERGLWKEKLPEIADEINIVNLTSDEENKGMLDPYIIMRKTKDAESLALDVLTFLTGISSRDGKLFPVLRRAVRAVTNSETRGLLRVIDALRDDGSETALAIADHIESFTDYDFAHLLFSNGKVQQTISLEKQLNIIQVADLVLPDKDTAPADYTTIEMLSISMLIVISTFALDFIHSDRSIFKMVGLDEAWAFLNVAQGKTLANKLVRAGRSMNAAVYFVTQNAGDVADENIKNNIGMKFAFRSTDINEIKKTLEFFGLDSEDENNQKRLRNLENGQCLFQDLYGRVGVIKFHVMFDYLFHAFDTRPPVTENEV